MSAAELAFVNGSVYTVDAARTRASAVAVEDGRIVAVGTDDDVRDRIDRATEVLDLHGRMLVPGFQDAHVHPVSGGVDRLQCDLHDLHSADDYVEAVAVLRGGAPGTRVDPRAAAGRWTCSRAGRPRRISSMRSCPTASCSCRTGTATARGSTAARSRSPASLTRHARSGRRPDRARRRTASPAAPSTRVPPTSVGDLAPVPTPAEVVRGPARGAAVPALPGDHGLAGRDRDHGDVDGQLLRLPPSGRERRSHRAGRRRPVVGSRSRRGADRRPGRAPRRRPRRALRRDEREDHAGRRVRERSRPRCWSPTSTPTATSRINAGSPSSTRRP